MMQSGVRNSECWMKLGEAAFALGVSEITLRRKVKGGKLPHEFRDGRYYVMLNRDPASGKYHEPISSVVAPIPELPPLRSVGDEVDSGRLIMLEQQVLEMRSMLEERDNRVRELQRVIEDQETLIYLLEQKVFAKTSASSPSL